MTPAKMTPEQRTRAVDLVRMGVPQVEVAHRYGVSHSVISKLVKDRREAAEPHQEEPWDFLTP